MVDQLEHILERAQWVNGDRPSKSDFELFNAFKQKPLSNTHPHTFAWYSLVSFFNSSVRESWPASPSTEDFSGVLASLANAPTLP